jgi:hypothetical protein
VGGVPRTSLAKGSLGQVAHRFDVVAFGVDDKGAVMVGVVVRPEARGTVVPSASGEGRLMKRVHLRSGFRLPCQVAARGGGVERLGSRHVSDAKRHVVKHGGLLE